MSGRLASKVALISGGASGLGEACARMFAREGAKVVLADIASEKAAILAQSLGDGAIALGMDVTEETDWERVTAAALEQFGRLDIAVNCAGISVARVSPDKASLDDWRRLMAINLDGVFLGTKHAISAMKRSDPISGSIINISSVLGIVGSAGLGAYSASKGGVRLFSKSAALSCAREGTRIRVNSIHPGYIDTPLLQTAVARFADRAEGIAHYNALAPIGRLGQPDDIAAGALYLASDEASFVTGAELVIDGGLTAE